MARDEDGDGMRIGDVLKESRTRQGLDIRTVEERTKIRTKYLRALENEEWDVLPNPAYAKGFLRTYAQLLGLDADALVDEYRRQVELVRGESTYPVGERVLEHRRPLGGAGPRSPALLWLGVAVAGIVGVLLVLGLFGGGDEDKQGSKQRHAQARAEKRAERRKEQRREQRQQAAPQESQVVTLRLEMHSDVLVCLLGDEERPLIDSQVLFAGDEEGPYEAKRFELRFPSGYDRDQFDLFLNGERKRLTETLGPTAYTIKPPDRIEPAPVPGPECP